MTDKISISLPDASLLKWAHEEAKRTGVSLSAVIALALHRARQASARARVVEWLGGAAELSPKREAEILAEWGGTDAPREAPARRPARQATKLGRRAGRAAR